MKKTIIEKVVGIVIVMLLIRGRFLPFKGVKIGNITPGGSSLITTVIKLTQSHQLYKVKYRKSQDEEIYLLEKIYRKFY